jgi:NAD(P)H-dependent flavin oxidoreductase YrpB (nitropropane dioxygenase family)
MSKLKTPLCELLGITLPIIQAPISASPELVAAVSNAGGLGMIQATWHNAEELSKTIAEVRRLTDRPFGANFVLSLTEEHGHSNLNAALEDRVPVVSTLWADPSPVIERIHNAGAIALHTVGSAQEARRVVDLGVDAVVAQGVEAGGHVWGQVGTMVLTPTVVDAVPDAHVAAAGGIADGRGLAAVLALGAGAAWVGTRFLLAREYDGHPVYREQIKRAIETDTVLSSVFDGGWPDASSRCLKNDTLEAWLAAGQPAPGERPNEGEVLAYEENGAPILRYSFYEPHKDMTGEMASLALYAGQGVGLSNEEKPVADIMEEMVADAYAILSQLARV